MIQTETDLAELPTTILVIEDEVILRFVAGEMLREAGFEVVLTANADEALMYLSTGAHVSLVFSDVEMPGTMDGFALADRLAADRPDLAVILTSGRRWSSNQLGGITFIQKPYDLPELLDQISTLLPANKKPANDQEPI